MRPISLYLSEKIKILSLLAIFFVLVIHTKFVSLDPNMIFNTFQVILCDYLCRVFQPLFFSISGYLFFIGFGGKIANFKEKYKKRVKSLLIPYLLWNILFLFQVFLLNNFPLTHSHINSELDFLYSRDCLRILFLDPYAFHLWFVRDLIFIVIFTPIIYYSIKKIGVFFVFFLVTIDLLFDASIITSMVPFSIGAFWAIFSLDVERRQSNYIILVLGIITVGIGTVFVIYNFSVNYYLTWPFLLFLWYGYDYLVLIKRNKFQKLLNLAKYTFFIYAFHEPSLNIFKRLFLLVPLENNVFLGFAFILTPIFSFIFSIIVACLLNRYLKPFYQVLIGGR